MIEGITHSELVLDIMHVYEVLENGPLGYIIILK